MDALVSIQEDTVPPRSHSSLSWCSQSTDYTDIFGDGDITQVIAQMSDDNILADTTFETAAALTQAAGELDAPVKRKRPDENHDDAPSRKRSRTTKSGSASTSKTVLPTAQKPQIASLLPSPLPPPAPVPVPTPVPPTTNITVEGFNPPRAIVVAYSRSRLDWLSKLPWGAQWEIARYVNTGFPMDRFTVPVLTDMTRLGNNSAAAPEVSKFVEKVSKSTEKGKEKASLDIFATAYARELSAKLPWGELDKEDEVHQKDEFGALGGNQSDTLPTGEPYWYGGKVHFTAKVVVAKDNGFQLVLDRPALGSSNRFMRRFGSRRFIRVRVQNDAFWQRGSALSEYFRRPFVIGGAVFRAFFAKEQNVFLFRTNEVVAECGDDITVTIPKNDVGRKEWSFMSFIKWHNDLTLNSDQTMAKWAARFALGLSNSVPGIHLCPENIQYEDDIICDAFQGPGKPPSEMQMTDGCGFANRATMRMLFDRFSAWECIPTAVQCRVGGAKGLLLVLLDLPAEMEERPMVWLRPSQIKIKYTAAPLSVCILPEGTDPAKLTIDVLRTSRMRTPAKLSTETIINFAENGAPFERFRDLFQINVSERINALLAWGDSNSGGDAGTKLPPASPSRASSSQASFGSASSPATASSSAMKILWDAIAREGGVMGARITREESGRARAEGYVVEDRDDDLEDEDGLLQLDQALQEQSTAWWEDPVSGQPSGLEETCMTLLDSGFRPETCAVLRAKLKEVARKAITTIRSHYKFAVPMSCSAFIVPDPYGVLGPGEIHVKSSRRNLPDAGGGMTDLVIGDVLVTRHPCKVPSDTQKVRAVHHDKLAHYCDVIVVSTASHIYEGKSLHRHLASLTGGGDYDGDTMEVFWDPNIVNDFIPADPNVFAVEPPRVKECLQKKTDTVDVFLAETAAASNEFMIYSLQKYLLGALQDKSLVGQYSNSWENSSYHNGYKHPDTIFLAYMFCAVLDGSKTGVTVIPSAYSEHCKNKIWQARSPAWKETDAERKKQDMGNRCNLTRCKSLPRFVMDQLREVIDKVSHQELVRIEKKFATDYDPLDEDLERPWKDANKRACALAERGEPAMSEELQAIKTHVEKMYAQAAEQRNERRAGSRRGKPGTGGGGGSPFTDLPIEKRQDRLRALSRAFHAEPTGLLCFDAVARVKASYAYVYDRQQNKWKSGWSRFPWDVATRALCEIKAEAIGFPKTMVNDFYNWMTVSHSYLRKHHPSSNR